MYNFTHHPGVLKAYIDHIVRVGVTRSRQRRTTDRQEGPPSSWPAVATLDPARPLKPINQASGYLRQVLGFIGMTDLDIVLADRRAAPRPTRERPAVGAVRRSGQSLAAAA